MGRWVGLLTSPAKVILIKPFGRLGNRMFQYLLARILQQSAPGVVISGADLSEFGLADPEPAEEFTGYDKIVITGHVFPFRETLAALKSSRRVLVRIEWPAMRMEYHGPHLSLARTIFPIDPGLDTGFDARHLVISIRGDAILRGVHPNYTVPPLAWYRLLIASTGLAPVFLGEIDDSAYCNALRAQFPTAQFVTHDNPLDDFNVLRTSKNVVVSVSSFSWMAAWLSTSATRIALPMIGLLNMKDRPDLDLLPVHDPRYELHEFPREHWTATPEQLSAKMTGAANSCVVTAPRLFRCRTALSLALTRRLPAGVSLARDLMAAMAPPADRVA